MPRPKKSPVAPVPITTTTDPALTATLGITHLRTYQVEIKSDHHDVNVTDDFFGHHVSTVLVQAPSADAVPELMASAMRRNPNARIACDGGRKLLPGSFTLSIRALVDVVPNVWVPVPNAATAHIIVNVGDAPVSTSLEVYDAAATTPWTPPYAPTSDDDDEEDYL